MSQELKSKDFLAWLAHASNRKRYQFLTGWALKNELFKGLATPKFQSRKQRNWNWNVSPLDQAERPKPPNRRSRKKRMKMDMTKLLASNT